MMNLQENINRIKEIMGLITEQTEEVIEVVKDSFTAIDCDELHAFQSTCPSREFEKGKCTVPTKIVGNMHEKMRIKLDNIYNQGINPKVSKVAVSVNGMTVTWTCTIVKSTDGKAWVGLTSRGAGCNNDIYNRALSVTAGNDVNSIKDRIEELYKEPKIDIVIEKVNDFIYDGAGDSFKQIFYRYTKPKNYPPHKSNSITPNPITPTQTTGGAIQQTNTSSLTVQDKLKKGQTLTPEELNVKGDLDLSGSNITSLPEGLKVDGSLSLNNCYDLTSLPKNLEVTGNLDLLGTKKLTSLPDGLVVWGFIQIKDSTLARIYTNDELKEMVGSNGYLPHINRLPPRPLSDITGTPQPTTGGSTQTSTTGTQSTTTGGETSTPPAQQTQTDTTGGVISTTPATKEFKYPTIEKAFKPTNGDPWKYAYDGENLIVKSPTTGKVYNLMYPEEQYKKEYPSSKLKNQEQLNNAIKAIKDAYGDKLGMS